MKKLFRKIFAISYEKDMIGEWRRIYVFGKCIHGKMLAKYYYI